MSKNELKKLVSFGNKKLPKSTMIFNMSSAMECSDALGLCAVSEICYAKKAERMYPQVKPYRDRQADYWLNNSACDILLDMIEVMKSKRIDITKLRFNEAGDFHSQSCVEKAEYIAWQLSLHGVRVYCYTARRDLDFSACKHLIVNGSNFKTEGVKRSFTAMTPRQIRQLQTSNVSGLLGDAVVNICPMDCTICALCASNSKKDIVVAMH